jgi:DNA-binding NarL/FixJ family response regulator
MIRLMIVDDHKILRDGIKWMLSDVKEIKIVMEASDGKEALGLLEKTPVDVILMDLSMPGMDGVEATARISEKYPKIKILALKMYEQASFIQLMFRNGAHGYLLKQANKEELLDAIHTVISDKRYLGTQTTELLLANFSGQQSAVKSFLPSLTRREREVLKLITKGMSDAAIAEELFVSPTTIESHRKNIRSKLGARNSAEIVRIAMERGLV